RARVIGQCKAVRVLRIDPDVVRIAAPRHCLERLTAVLRLPEAAVGNQYLIRIPGGHLDVDVVAGAADECSLPVHILPCASGVIGSPHGSLISGLYQCIDAIRIGRRNGDVDLAERRLRKARIGELAPRVATIARHVEPARWTTAQHYPGVHHDLPHSGEHDVRIVRIHRQPGASRAIVDEQHACPRLAPISRAIHSALLLRTGRASERADEYDVRVGRIDYDPANSPRLAQAHVLPRLACIRGLVNPVTHDVRIANRPRLAGPGPYGAGFRRSSGERTDRLNVHTVKHWHEGATTIARLPHTARRRAHVPRTRITRDARHRSDATTVRRPHVLESKRFRFKPAIWRARTLRHSGRRAKHCRYSN